MRKYHRFDTEKKSKRKRRFLFTNISELEISKREKTKCFSKGVMQYEERGMQETVVTALVMTNNHVDK